MSPAQFVVPTGIAALVSLLTAVLTGLGIYKFNLYWIRMSWHVAAGLCTLVFGLAHAVLVMLCY